jgi:hypothetical protein
MGEVAKVTRIVYVSCVGFAIGVLTAGVHVFVARGDVSVWS